MSILASQWEKFTWNEGATHQSLLVSLKCHGKRVVTKGKRYDEATRVMQLRQPGGRNIARTCCEDDAIIGCIGSVTATSIRTNNLHLAEFKHRKQEVRLRSQFWFKVQGHHGACRSNQMRKQGRIVAHTSP